MAKDYVYAGGGTKQRHVWIATPTTETVVLQYALALSATVDSLARSGLRFSWHFLQGNCHVDDARNHMIAKFLESDASDLVWIDSDQRWRAEDFFRLLKHDADIVAGIPCHKGDEQSYPYHAPPGARVNADGLIEVEHVGTGFMRIRRDVLERLFAIEIAGDRKFYDNTNELRIARIVERGFPDELNVPGDYYLSGDLVLCAKAKRAGFQVFVDPECKLGHVGTMEWDGHLAGYLRQTKGIDEPDFVREIETFKETGACDFDRLSAASGNALYVLKGEELARIVDMVRTTEGPILECGTGVSTLLMALADPGRPIVALEHDPLWHDEMLRRLRTYARDCRVHLGYAPLDWYGTGWWYGLPEKLPPSFGLVVCDGPPKRYGRKTLFNLMAPLISDAAVFLDDIQNDPETLGEMKRWAQDNGQVVATGGTSRLYAYTLGKPSKADAA